ncbi:MAG: hypothetical protein OEQ74_03965 [Gammaproteobacteria bacterium]|nr:hypothetical protein [Gammaproteobacteria bacterium]
MNSEEVFPGIAAEQPSAAEADQESTNRNVNVARSNADRRTFTWRTIVHSFFRPRRQRVNRAADARNHYVDHHPQSTVWLCAGIVCLAAVDAFLMLYYNDIGVRQLNGLVATLIDTGRGVYVAAKLVGTAACLLLIVSVSNLKVFRLLPARNMLYILFFGYLAYILILLRHFG